MKIYTEKYQTILDPLNRILITDWLNTIFYSITHTDDFIPYRVTIGTGVHIQYIPKSDHIKIKLKLYDDLIPSSHSRIRSYHINPFEHLARIKNTIPPIRHSLIRLNIKSYDMIIPLGRRRIRHFKHF